MKKFLESIKDLIYDSIDYIIMFCIIGLVVVVIGWRLDILFADDLTDMPVSNVEENTDQVEDNEDSDLDSTENNEDIATESDKNDQTSESDEDNENTPSDTDIVQVIIPQGSLPSNIGSILESKGLISSKSDFIEKSQAMNLDTKLKSGDYEIKQGSTLEEIVKMIAK